jgi:TATA-binding protein-associated factor
LHSKSYDTRTAASVALSQVFSLVPVWQPSYDEDAMAPSGLVHAPDFPTFSVQELMQKGKLLLASSGKEFVKPAGILSSSAEVKKARKEAMGRLGLDFLDSFGDDEMDLDKELAADAETDPDVEMHNTPKIEEPCPRVSERDESTDPDVQREPSPPPRSKSASPSTPSPSTPAGPSANDTALSARERNRLKRKRKPGNSAFVAAPPPQNTGSKFTATAAGPSNK